MSTAVTAAWVTILVTPILTGAVTYVTGGWAARRGMQLELEKQRRDLGHRRRLEWYEQAITAGRELVEEHFRVHRRLGAATSPEVIRQQLALFAEFQAERRAVFLLGNVFATGHANRATMTFVGVGQLKGEYERALADDPRRAQERLLRVVAALGDQMMESLGWLTMEARVHFGYGAAAMLEAEGAAPTTYVLPRYEEIESKLSSGPF